MGPLQHTPAHQPNVQLSSARLCLRKGCGNRFHPRRWNQCYCQDPACLREVRRWHAAKRQRVFRESAENRKRHAQAEAQRRRAKKEAALGSNDETPQATSSEPLQRSAWSRSNEIPEDFCDRPGCYDPLPTNSRAPVRYCGAVCRQAVRRVRDRERKWLKRRHVASTTLGHDHSSSNCAKHPSAKIAQRMVSPSNRNPSWPPNSDGVVDYWNRGDETLSSSPVHDSHSRSTHDDDDSKTSSDPRPRPPPTG